MQKDGVFVKLYANHFSVASKGDIVAGPWFDSKRQKLLYARDNGFYWFDPFARNEQSAHIQVHACSDTWPLSSLQPILFAAISLDSRIIAFQRSKFEVVVLSTENEEKWNLTIKHSSEDNVIVPPGIVRSEHGGKSQDLVILTSRGLELYKVAPAKSQCKVNTCC